MAFHFRIFTNFLAKYDRPHVLNVQADYLFTKEEKREKITHNVKVGIYNVMNRHNHFSLYYDNEDAEWKQVYIFPMMPNLNWMVEF